ncbi:hypothetical protein EDI_265950 [Entamoeba dispar SAW760]|uniref:Uncharacterized protein n=1 Tax=Entamoeba dispar (strain ATCC PRA-260 / SAW760) TaxID=370354 RepID=B0EBV5_ENTDS|nr:uncharacterized protein EDI_265950 [Entamoeba dispar SAW760]EDR28000.1 hypothetical protein EDI_265950 [Entamoeba dispar SAW760]|eukprot:EDR28000.1 hypothetical protein EDI_265950 [Entamoeba dispar SAW760]
METLIAKYGKEIAKETIEDVFQRCNGNLDDCQQQIDEMLTTKIGERTEKQEEKKDKTPFTSSYHTTQQNPSNTQSVFNLNQLETKHYDINSQAFQIKRPTTPKTQPINSSILPKFFNTPNQEINQSKPIQPIQSKPIQPILQKPTILQKPILPILPKTTPIYSTPTIQPYSTPTIQPYSTPTIQPYSTPTINNIKKPIKEESEYLIEQSNSVIKSKKELTPKVIEKRTETTVQTRDNKKEEEKEIERLKEENKIMKKMIQEQRIEIKQLKEKTEESNQLIRQILQILSK